MVGKFRSLADGLTVCLGRQRRIRKAMVDPTKTLFSMDCLK
jgi:hypothetical protein